MNIDLKNMALKSQKEYGHGYSITIGECIINSINDCEKRKQEMLNAYKLGIEIIKNI